MQDAVPLARDEIIAILNQIKLIQLMSTPNVAVAFPQTARDAITQKINDAKAAFPVLASVSNEERKKLQVIAEGREPYVAGAASDARANPLTVLGTVDVNAWTLLEEQHAGLVQMESAIVGLLELLQDTKAIVGSQRYDNARRYYRYLQDNLDKLSGADPIYERLGQLFAGQGNRGTPAGGGTNPPTT